MAETEPTDPKQVAALTLVQLRRLDERTQTIMEILLRHDERLGRLERDIAEIKSDMILLENRLLNQTNRILNELARIEDKTFGLSPTK